MTSSERASDQRSTSRRRVLKGGKIIFRAGYSVIDCIVRDESEMGARLKVATTLSIPETFQLRIMKAAPRDVQVVWRTGQELGIEFALPGQDYSPWFRRPSRPRTHASCQKDAPSR